MSKRPASHQQPDGISEDAARKAHEQSQTALENTHKGYGGKQNDRAANNQSGMGSQGGARDNTSGAHSGNQ